MDRRRQVGPFAIAAIIAALLIPASPAHVVAVSPGSPGPIVYAQYGPGGQMLFTAMPGGEAVPVPGTEGARAGRWSPDGRVIAYAIWEQGIYLINPDGSGRVLVFPLAPGEIFGEPVWSPDGRRIAFSVLSPGDSDFHIEIGDSMDGAREVVPTGLLGVWDWLDDGTFLGSAWRYTGPDPSTRNEEIAEMAPDGTMTYLTDTPDADEGVPRLSPDGTRISFLTAPAQLGVPISYSLGVMDRNGADRHEFALGTQVTWPAWSPSGTEIVVGPVPTAIRADLAGSRRLINGGGSGDGLDWAALAGTTDPIPLEGIRTEVGRDPSTKTSTVLSASTIWPTRDGYRDTLKITEQMAEPARARLDIYGPTGHRVRRVYFSYDTGSVAYRWNGRTAGGSILPAGRYRLVTTSKDLAGNIRHVTKYVWLRRGRL